MEIPKPFCIRYISYTPQEAADLLGAIAEDDSKNFHTPPIKPKGDVYIISSLDGITGI